MNLLVRLILTTRRAGEHTSEISEMACEPCAMLFSSGGAASSDMRSASPAVPSAKHFWRIECSRCPFDHRRRLRGCTCAIRSGGCLPHALRVRRSCAAHSWPFSVRLWSDAPIKARQTCCMGSSSHIAHLKWSAGAGWTGPVRGVTAGQHGDNL